MRDVSIRNAEPESAQHTGKDLQATSIMALERSKWVTARKLVPPIALIKTPACFKAADNRRWTEGMADHIEDDDVRVDILRIDPDRRDLLQPSRQTLGVVMVLFQSSNIVFQRIDAGGGEDSGLPHRTAIHTAQPLSLVEEDQIIHHEERTGRCSESFREAD